MSNERPELSPQPPGEWQPDAAVPQWPPPPPAQQVQGGVDPGWAPPVPVAGTEPESYASLWRGAGVGRIIGAMVLGILGIFVLPTITVLIGALIETRVSGMSLEALFEELAGGSVTDIMLLANSAGLALLVPLAFILQLLVRQRPGFISSVAGRLRWGLLLGTAALALVVGAAGQGIAMAAGVGTDVEFQLKEGWWWLLIGIVLITPFQAAGEEYLVRGLVLRGVGSLIPNRWAGFWVGAAISSAIFAGLHFAGDMWLNLFYVAMGLLFCWTTLRTGGLEIAIALHAVNNLVALSVVPFTDTRDLFDREAGVAGPEVLIQLGVLLLIALPMVSLARRRGIRDTARPVEARR